MLQAPHLQPKHINGWFWSGSGSSIPATNVTAPGWGDNPWSHTGYLSQFVSHDVPQPDNAEYLLHRSDHWVTSLFGQIGPPITNAKFYDPSDVYRSHIPYVNLLPIQR